MEEVIEADSVLTEDGSVSRVVVFDCGRKSAKCFTISCNLPRLARRDFAVIKLRSRVWNCSLVEDYPHIDSVVSARSWSLNSSGETMRRSSVWLTASQTLVSPTSPSG